MRAIVIALLLLVPQVAAAQEAVRPVISEIVTADPARARAFPGVVEGENVTTLAFQTTGRMATLAVEAGDTVGEGDVLATLDEVTLEQDVQAARATLDAAEAEANLAQQQLDRAQQAVQRGIASESQLEQLQANRASVAAQVESARATLSQAQDAAGYGTLSAPRDAIVLSTSVEPGSLVSPGTPILQIADPDGREALIDVPAAFAAVLPDDPVFEVSHHSAGVPPVSATLRLIEPVTDASLDTRRLRLTLADPPGDYRVGSLVTAAYAANGDPLMTVPLTAIAGLPDAPALWRVDPADRTVAQVPVELGATIGDRVVVTSGIAVGDEIVTRGIGALSEGQEVGARL